MSKRDEMMADATGGYGAHASAELELIELTALLKRVDRIEFHGGERWLYRSETGWEVREGWGGRGTRMIAHSPNLIEALKVLLSEEAI